ncbi:MAG: hypothetical protein DRH10_00235 [Deltaproteobacteria bacterium]|nr:MAG: hypothetical protein DRH10_00235 [Deltaproteobacteria bacterium]
MNINNCLRKALPFIMMVLSVALVLPERSAAAAIDKVLLYTPHKTIEKGHDFTVQVKVQPEDGSPVELYGARLDVVYDPAYLEVVDVQPFADKVYPKVVEGDILNEGGTTQTLLLSALVDNQPGRLTIGLVRKGPVEGVTVSDEGLLLSVYFRAIAKVDETAIGFGLKGLRDSENLPITVNSWGWEGDNLIISEEVVYRLDVNDDDVIDLKDLILTMQVQAGIPVTEAITSKADFSGNRIIDMAEAIGIMQVLAGLRTPPE